MTFLHRKYYKVHNILLKIDFEIPLLLMKEVHEHTATIRNMVSIRNMVYIISQMING